MENTILKHSLTVGEVARRSGIAVSTIHFYEAKGLIEGWRTAGNQRRYHRAVLRRIAIIRIAQRAGIQLSIIRDAMADLPQDRVATTADWRRFLPILAGNAPASHQQPDHAARPAYRLYRLRVPFAG